MKMVVLLVVMWGSYKCDEEDESRLFNSLFKMSFFHGPFLMIYLFSGVYLSSFTAKKADNSCYEQFNTYGSHTGHCGRDQNGDFRKCHPANVMCGSLHCKDGKASPMMQSKYTSATFHKTTIAINGVEHECKNLNSPKPDASADLELVRNGTRCGDGMVMMCSFFVLYDIVFFRGYIKKMSCTEYIFR